MMSIDVVENAARESRFWGAEYVPFDKGRINWVSADARKVWEPRFDRVAAASLDLEWQSVAAGVREAAVVIMDFETLERNSTEWQTAGLAVVPLEMRLRTQLVRHEGSGNASALFEFEVALLQVAESICSRLGTRQPDGDWGAARDAALLHGQLDSRQAAQIDRTNMASGTCNKVAHAADAADNRSQYTLADKYAHGVHRCPSDFARPLSLRLRTLH
jgi:hypothetical protein